MAKLKNIGAVAGTCLLAALFARGAEAQVRRPAAGAARPSLMQPQGQAGVAIKKIEATGPGAKARTPEFRNDAGEMQTQAKEWARISVHYEVEQEWIDELEFQYQVIVKDKSGAFSRFPCAVTYVDVPKGKKHVSTVFLRPNTVERFGAVEWAGVKIFIKGEQVAIGQMPDDPRYWQANLKTVDGVLLNRSQTPFALVAIDNYQTIKPK